MIGVSVRANVSQVMAGLAATQRRHIPFATALALTRTAQAVLRIEQAAMVRVFDRPTPFTLNSIAVRPATKARLSAEVFFREFAGKGIAGGKYLKPEVYGGARRPKRSELALRAAGILRPDEFIVPAKGFPLDAFGNLPSGLMQRILAQLKAQRDPSLNEGARGRSRRRRPQAGHYFVPGEGSALPRGVWERFGSRAIRPVLIFVREPRYRARYPFYEIAAEQSRLLFPAEFGRALARALATAR